MSTIREFRQVHLRQTDVSDFEFWQAQPARVECFTYFIQDESGPVKIGRGVNPPLRLNTCQIGNPRDLTLRQVLPWNVENHLHWRFKDYRVRNEWFGEPELILAFADACAQQARDTYDGGEDIPAPPSEITYLWRYGPCRKLSPESELYLQVADLWRAGREVDAIARELGVSEDEAFEALQRVYKRLPASHIERIADAA